jgi:hypothetical protein
LCLTASHAGSLWCSTMFSRWEDSYTFPTTSWLLNHVFSTPQTSFSATMVLNTKILFILSSSLELHSIRWETKMRTTLPLYPFLNNQSHFLMVVLLFRRTTGGRNFSRNREYIHQGWERSMAHFCPWETCHIRLYATWQHKFRWKTVCRCTLLGYSGSQTSNHHNSTVTGGSTC